MRHTNHLLLKERGAAHAVRSHGDNKERTSRQQEEKTERPRRWHLWTKELSRACAVTSPVAVGMQSKANAVGDPQQRHRVPLLPLLHWKGREEDRARECC